MVFGLRAPCVLVAILISSTTCLAFPQNDMDWDFDSASTAPALPSPKNATTIPPKPSYPLPPPPPPPMAPMGPVAGSEVHSSEHEQQQHNEDDEHSSNNNNNNNEGNQISPRVTLDFGQIRKDLSDYFIGQRHLTVSPENLLGAKEYIRSAFEKIGLKPRSQTFSSSIHEADGIHTPVKGENIYAELRGVNWDTSADELFVVGAHYDTSHDSEGINDNGSGILAMLETAKSLVRRSQNNENCKHFHSVVFVAFDLQLREHMAPASNNMTGSEAFVKSYLDPILKKRGNDVFAGAFILDSVMNFNDTRNSQRLGDGFRSLFPDIYEKFQKSDNRGNALVLVNANKPKDETLALDVLKHWNEAAQMIDLPSAAPMYKATVDPASSTDSTATPTLLHFLKQDHLSFWNFFRNHDEHIHLPAVLLTDTGAWRSRTLPCAINSEDCDPALFITENRLKFLQKTVDTLDLFLSKGDCEVPSGASTLSSLPGIIQLAYMAAFAVGAHVLARF